MRVPVRRQASVALAAPAIGRVLAVAAAALVATLVIRQTWVSDDAFITMRTVESVLRGDGLVWNPGQRVQGYTHPLWLALLVPIRALVRNAWWAAAILGWSSSAVALALLVRLARSPARAALVLLGFALAKPLLHYATSGLENPLSHALLLGMALATADDRPTLPTLRAVGLLGALLLLTRLDLAVAGAPIVIGVLVALRRERPASLARALVPGLAFLAAWEAFSLVYYGALVPNTAFAKLSTGLPIGERIEQGVRYLVACTRWDPWTSTLIVAGVALGLARGRGPERAWALGAAAYVGYAVWIGGDFMVGRFLTAPAVLALSVVARTPLSRRARAIGLPAIGALAIALATVAPRTPWHLPARRGEAWARDGVADEQSFYYADSGLFWSAPVEGRSAPPRHGRVQIGRAMAPGQIAVHGMIGFQGWGAADRGVIVDPIGLTDPFLARLPAERDTGWRPGHLHRHLPDGYVETLRDGICRMREPGLCALFEHLDRVARDPLFSAARLESIWLLQTGRLDAAIDRERFYRPDLVRRSVEALALRPARFGDSGIAVALPERAPVCIEASVDGGTVYGVLLRDDRVTRCAREVDLRDRPARPTAVEMCCDAPVDELLVEPRARPPDRPTHQLGAVVSRRR